MRSSTVYAGVSALAVVAATTLGGVAVAGGGDDGPASHDYTDRQAADARAAALAETGGGRVNSVEVDHEDGATFEVELTTPQGDTVDVRLDRDYRVVVVEGDGG